MARRRVNVKFVIGLSAVLAILAITAIAIFVIPTFRDSDPDRLAKQGQEALDAGDLENALRYYGRAVNTAVRKRMPQSAQLVMTLGDIYYNNLEKDRKFLGQAIGYWRSALVQDPSYLPAQKKLCDVLYQVNTMLGADARSWDSLEQELTRLIKLDPKNAEAYVRRAEATLARLNIDEQSSDRQAKVVEDLQKAIELDSSRLDAHFLLTRLWLGQARVLEARQKTKEAQALRTKALEFFRGYARKHVDDSKTWVSLGRIQVEVRENDEAEKSYAKAVTMGLNDVESARVVADYYANHKNDQAEKIYRRIIEIEPVDIASYLPLAGYYEANQRFSDAIDVLKQALNKKNSATGIKFQRNAGMEVGLLASLVRSHLYAAGTDPTLAPAKEHLQQASSYIEQIRGLQANHPLLPSLEGYSLLLRGKPDAVAMLKKADEQLAGAKGARAEWLNNKLWLARAFERTGDTGLAIKTLNEILQEVPSNASVLIFRAGLESKLNQFDKAIATADLVLKVDPKNENAMRIKANALARLGKVRESQALFQSIASPDAMLSVAQLQLSSGEIRPAVNLLEKMLHDQPDNQRALLLMINAQMALRAETDDKTVAESHRKIALTYLDKALSKNPDNLQFKLMRSKLENENFDMTEFLQRSIEEMSDAFDRNVAWAGYYQARKDNARQLEYLRKAEELRPESAEIIERIFNIALANKNWDMAEEYAQKAQRLNLDGAGGKFFDGKLLMERGNRKDSIATLKAAVAVRPDYSNGRTALAMALIRADQNEAAIEELQKAIEQRPENVIALGTLIELLLKRGDSASVSQAQRYLVQGMTYAPNDPRMIMFDEFIGDAKRGIARREQARIKDPDNEDNIVRLAALYRRDNQPRKAIALAKPLWDKSQANMMLGNQLAGAYQQAGETNNALTVYQQMVASTDPKIRYQAHLELAQMYMNMGQFNEALATLEAAVKIQPAEDNSAERSLALLTLQLDNAPKAETLLRSILAKKPEDVETQQRLVSALIRQSKFAEADGILSKLLKNNPKNEEAMLLQGESLMRQKKFADAQKVYTAILQSNPDNARALYARALGMLSAQGDLEAITRDLVAARRQTDGRQQGQPTEIRQTLARIYAQRGQYFDALREWEDLVTLQPEYIQARMEYARLLLALSEAGQKLNRNSSDSFAVMIRQAQPADRLKALLAESVKKFPGQPIWVLMQAQLYAALGQQEQSLDRYRAAYEDSNQSLLAAVAYTGALNQAKNYDKTIDIATKLLVTNPDTVDLYLRRAAALAALGKIPEAESDYAKALDMAKDPGVTLAIYQQIKQALPEASALSFGKSRAESAQTNDAHRLGYGSMLSGANKHAEVLAVVKPLLADTKSPLRPLELRMGALAAYLTRDFGLAQQYYDELLKLNPDDVESLNNLAFMLADDMKKPAEGLKYAQRAAELVRARTPLDGGSSNMANLYDTIGWVKFLAGDLKGAAEELNRSLQWEPLPDAYMHLAQVLKKQGNAADAKKQLELCVKVATERQDTAKLTAAKEMLKGF